MASLLSLFTGPNGIGFGGSSSNSNVNTTQNTNQQFNQAASQAGTTTSARDLTPFQSQLQAPLFSYIRSLMLPGGATAALAPFAAGARDATSNTYSGLADSLRQQFLSTGGGRSGKYGMALTGGNLARLGALQGVDTSFAQSAAELPLTASTLATSLLGMPFGSTTTATGQSNTSGTQTGQTTGTQSSQQSGSSFHI